MRSIEDLMSEGGRVERKGEASCPQHSGSKTISGEWPGEQKGGVTGREGVTRVRVTFGEDYLFPLR